MTIEIDSEDRLRESSLPGVRNALKNLASRGGLGSSGQVEVHLPPMRTGNGSSAPAPVAKRS